MYAAFKITGMNANHPLAATHRGLKRGMLSVASDADLECRKTCDAKRGEVSRSEESSNYEHISPQVKAAGEVQYQSPPLLVVFSR